MKFDDLNQEESTEVGGIPPSRIILPTWGFTKLFQLYRELNGAPPPAATGDDESAEACPFPSVEEGSPKKWIEIRGQFPVVTPPVYLSLWPDSDWGIAKPDRNVTEGLMANCRAGSFTRAVAQLKRMHVRYNGSSPETAAWLKAQDAVFSQCDGDVKQAQPIPEPLADDAPAELRLEREYQRASWQLYAGENENAARWFAALETNPDRERAAEARYSAARAYLRYAELDTLDLDKQQEAYKKGEELLLRNMKENDAPFAEESCRYLDFTKNRDGEMARLLAPLVLRAGEEDSILFDRWRFAIAAAVRWSPEFDGRGEGIRKKLSRQGLIRPPAREADLNDWIISVKRTGADETTHALIRWKESRTVPWLIAALQHASGSGEGEDELLDAAVKVPFEGVAGATVGFHRARILLIQGDRAGAAQLLDSLIESTPSADVLTRNILLALRMRAAGSLEELVKFGMRRGYGRFSESQLIGDALAADSAAVWTEAMPLSKYEEGLALHGIPREYAFELANACWTRSYVLGQRELMDSCGKNLAAFAPETAPMLQEITAEPGSGRRAFLEALFLLRFPGLRPYVRAGGPREYAIDEIHDFGDNWWCPLDPSTDTTLLDSNGGLWSPRRDYYLMTSQAYEGLPRLTAPYPSRRDAVRWLTDDERKQGEEEWAKVRTSTEPQGRAVDAVIEWVEANPDEPLAAEALHRVVRRGTRFGCGEAYEIVDRMRAKAERAFRFLKKHYPTSEWSKKTVAFG